LEVIGVERLAKSVRLSAVSGNNCWIGASDGFDITAPNIVRHHQALSRDHSKGNHRARLLRDAAQTQAAFGRRSKALGARGGTVCGLHGRIFYMVIRRSSIKRLRRQSSMTSSSMPPGFLDGSNPMMHELVDPGISRDPDARRKTGDAQCLRRCRVRHVPCSRW
jgi:hypothetical protein